MSADARGQGCADRSPGGPAPARGAAAGAAGPGAAEPPRCDLVMEGGVTSAVVYAGLLLELHRSYRLRSIGGTSAGAVAAAAGAVAEARRASSGDPGGFVHLDKLLHQLEVVLDGRTGLRRLFRPAAPLRPAFEYALLVLRQPWHDGRLRAAAGALGGLLRWFPAGALLGSALLVAPLALAGGVSIAIGAALLPATALLAVAGSLAQAAWVLLRRLPGNLFGLCTGLGNRWSDGGTLTETLHGFYNEQAGRDAAGEPVRFANLWHAAAAPPGGPAASRAPAERAVDLQMITTAVELQRRVQLPGLPGQEPMAPFFYDPAEWARLFPAPVLLALRRDAPAGRRPTGPDGQALWPLPPMARLPVVVAVRLSLSFPLLLSAVPMYTLAAEGGVVPRGDGSGGVDYRFARVHFSDGGITSNCPVDLFDQPLPRHPTFAVNLYTLPDPRAKEPVVRWSSRQEELDGPSPAPPSNGREPGAVSMPRFLWDILMAGLEWRDRAQRRLPGTRERVLDVGLPAGLGGLNLEMKGPDIQALVKVGRCAAQKMAGYAQPDQGFTFSRWEQHRWLRLRSTLAALQAYARALHQRRGIGAPAYADLLASRPTPEPQLDGADAVAQGRCLLDGAAALGAAKEPTAIERQAPEPRPTLGLRPPL